MRLLWTSLILTLQSCFFQVPCNQLSHLIFPGSQCISLIHTTFVFTQSSWSRAVLELCPSGGCSLSSIFLILWWSRHHTLACVFKTVLNQTILFYKSKSYGLCFIINTVHSEYLTFWLPTIQTPFLIEGISNISERSVLTPATEAKKHGYYIASAPNS